MSSELSDRPPFVFAIPGYPLAPATYYRVGGPARWALLPDTVEEAAEAYAWLRRQPGRSVVLGCGSNVLVSDAGFDGVVLFTTNLTGIETLGNDRFRVAAGVPLDTLVRDVMLVHNYEGVGALAGIPGSVGGAIFMNAGTANGNTGELLESVEVMAESDRTLIPVTPAHLGYRSQTVCPPGGVILAGVFSFRRSDRDQKAVYDHYMERRRTKQPAGFCCGSVFKNPPNEHAGRLIEACGLKGTRHGGAVISPMHANFIMNEQAATCADVLALISLCKQRVLDTFGIQLEEEVRIIA